MRGKIVRQKMKKKFVPYLICWAILLALFNVIVFETPDEIAGISKFSNGFWIGYGFTLAAFFGQLLCASYALKEEGRKLFYHIPLIAISYTTLILTAIAGIVFMAVPQIPAWIAAIVCSIILAFGAIAVIKARTAAEVVSGIDEKIQSKTSFMKELTARANVVVMNAASEQKAEAKKVYEAIRYSDPMSCEELSGVEGEIARKFDAFERNVNSATANDVIALVNKRASLCKMLKK